MGMHSPKRQNSNVERSNQASRRPPGGFMARDFKKPAWFLEVTPVNFGIRW
jgi:hypothetical protein